MTYAVEFYEDYLKPNGIFYFSHKDIQRETDTNCTYSVVQDLRALLDTMGYCVKEEWQERINKRNQKRRFKQYYIEKKEENMPELVNIGMAFDEFKKRLTQ